VLQNFVVDVGGPFKAVLPALAFENATRRNRRVLRRGAGLLSHPRLPSPALVVGSLVYCRVEVAPRDADPQLTCVDASGKAAGMGPLLGGLPFDLPTGAARRLLARPPPPALAALGAALAFELVVGVNGRCWVAAPDTASCVLVAAALRGGAARPEQAEALVAALLAVHAQAKS